MTWDLLSQVDVIDEGDRFKLRHKIEPGVFSGTISSADRGSQINGEIQVPMQSFYRFLVRFVAFVCLVVMSTSAYDLAFGTHLLRTRSRYEIGLGHLANTEAHFAVFIFAPAIAAPIIFMLWPRARGLTREGRATLLEFAQELFQTKGCSELAGTAKPNPLSTGSGQPFS